MKESVSTMNFGDWFQVISVIIAAGAAIASWKAASITAKQYKLSQQEKKTKIKPLFRIRKIHRQTDGFFLDIENLGHPFYYIKEVEFTGEGIKITDYMNGEIGTSRKNAIDSLMIMTLFESKSNIDGFFKLTVLDVEGNKFKLRSPNFSIENGTIKNGNSIHKQYFIEL